MHYLCCPNSSIEIDLVGHWKLEARKQDKEERVDYVGWMDGAACDRCKVSNKHTILDKYPP